MRQKGNLVASGTKISSSGETKMARSLSVTVTASPFKKTSSSSTTICKFFSPKRLTQESSVSLKSSTQKNPSSGTNKGQKEHFSQSDAQEGAIICLDDTYESPGPNMSDARHENKSIKTIKVNKSKQNIGISGDGTLLSPMEIDDESSDDKCINDISLVRDDSVSIFVSEHSNESDCQNERSGKTSKRRKLILEQKLAKQGNGKKHVSIENMMTNVNFNRKNNSDKTLPLNRHIEYDDSEKLKVDSMIEVQRRMWPGMNKPGGTARVTKCYYLDDQFPEKITHVDVRYVVVGGKEKKVPKEYCIYAPQFESTTRKSKLRLKRTRENCIQTSDEKISQTCDPLPVSPKKCSIEGAPEGGECPFRLGLIRVPTAKAPLSELCNSLDISKLSTQDKEKIYPIFSNSILGRDGHQRGSGKGFKKSEDMNKIRLGIPHDASYVSRNQIHVMEIKPSNISAEETNDLLPSSNLANPTEFGMYLQKLQKCLPTVKVQICSSAPQGVNIIKPRVIDSNLKKSKGGCSNARADKALQSSSFCETGCKQNCETAMCPNGVSMHHTVKYIRPSMMIILKVGDTIEFDAFNRSQAISRKSLFRSCDKEKRSGAGVGPNGVISQDLEDGEYIYRLVAFYTEKCEFKLDRHLITNTPLMKKEEKAIQLQSHDTTIKNETQSGNTEKKEICVSKISEDSQPSITDRPTINLPRKKTKEIHPSLGNSLWRALNSAEPHNGFGLLAHLLTVFTIIPNNDLTRKLLDLICISGPKSEGTKFRDPNRTELASTYPFYLTSRLDEIISSYLPFATLLSFSDVKSIVSLPIKDNQFSKVSKRAVSSVSGARRLSFEFQMYARSIGFLHECLVKIFADSIKSGTRAYSGNPFIHDILSYGTRSFLKLVTECTIRCWLDHGHWLFYQFEEMQQGHLSSHHQLCISEARNYLKSLGRILCITSWLHCKEEGVEFAHKDCCILIDGVVRVEINKYRNTDAASLGNAVKDSEQEDESFREVLINFVLSLDTDFSAPLQKGLATMFNVSNSVHAVTGF